LGLGLHIASEIAKAHGGALEVASTLQETRFTFRMPLNA
jgi:sigma-B regulation protein RsbU (phosphoserine phosphatase)